MSYMTSTWSFYSTEVSMYVSDGAGMGFFLLRNISYNFVFPEPWKPDEWAHLCLIYDSQNEHRIKV